MHLSHSFLLCVCFAHHFAYHCCSLLKIFVAGVCLPALLRVDPTRTYGNYISSGIYQYQYHRYIKTFQWRRFHHFLIKCNTILFYLLIHYNSFIHLQHKDRNSIIIMEDANKRKRKEEAKALKRKRIEESGGVRPRRVIDKVQPDHNGKKTATTTTTTTSVLPILLRLPFSPPHVMSGQIISPVWP